MAFSKKTYAKGEKPNDFFGQYAGSNKFNKYFYLRIGRIVEIDYEQYRLKIEWVTGSGGSPDWMPISFPYVGPGSCIGAMPELNALALFGYIDEGSGKGSPMCLSYIPTNLQAALEHNSIKIMPDQVSTEEQKIQFSKFRKMQKGDVVMTSLFGGEIFINNDLELKDSMKDSILLRRSDQSIISTSLNNFQFSDGVAIAAGQVIRNKYPIFDSKGQRIPNQLAHEVTLPDGRDAIYIVPFGAQIDDNAQFFSEYRVDVEDMVNGNLDINDINSQTSLSNRDPIITLAMGNYVGALGTNARYGKILRPILFASPTDIAGQFNLIQCVQNKGIDEVKTLGLAFAIHLLKNDSLFGFDKEGHCYLNLNASTSANPMGAGRSMSILGSGSLKEIWGQNAYDGVSWDLSTKGGIKWNIGSNNVKGSSRSIEIKAASGMKIEVRNEDADKFAKQELIYGKTNTVIGGAETKSVSGNSELTIDGLKKEVVRGSAAYDYHSDKTENVLGIYTQTVTKEMQGKFGKRKETVLLGQELEIMTGDDKETIKTFGNKKTTLTLGNIEETIYAGNKKVSIKAGNYTVDILAGNVNIKTKAGSATIDALGGVTISGLAGVTVKGSTVNLGMGPVRGGVVTGLPGVPSHFDYTTGMPLKGCATVKAGL